MVTSILTAELFEVTKNLENHTSTALERINLLCRLTQKDFQKILTNKKDNIVYRLISRSVLSHFVKQILT